MSLLLTTSTVAAGAATGEAAAIEAARAAMRVVVNCILIVGCLEDLNLKIGYGD